MSKRIPTPTALAAALLLTGLAAQAQTSAPAAAETTSQQLERVEVTGSRLKTVNADTSSPVVSLTSEAIKVEAQRDVEGLLNNLPSVFADQGGQVSNGSTGTATVNLRNLGANRTLVLINGRRLPAGSPGALATDLNQIPVSLVKRADVLTGGASAVYGSDAIAGVVNFVMNDSFQGVQLDLNHQFYNHQQHSGGVADAARLRGYPVPGDKLADGKATDYSLTLGGNFADGRGNATLFIGHKTQGALLQSERDFTACALNAGDNIACGGSSTSYPGRFISASDGLSRTVADAKGGVRAFDGAKDAYNFGPLNYLQRPSQRYTAAAFAHYDINSGTRLYTEMNFHDDHTVAQIAPSGIFGLMVTANYDNPLLSQAWKDALNTANMNPSDSSATPTTFNKSGDTAMLSILRRNVEGGGRQDDLRHTSYRGVIGLKGDINSAWSYDVALQSGKVVYQETYYNDLSKTRIGRALDVVKDSSGNIVCRSVVNGTDPACVPYDIWKLGGVTPQALAYLQTPGFQRGNTQQSIGTASVSGDLTDAGVKTPWARGGLGLVLGVERRKESMSLSTDQAFSTFDLAGQSGPVIGVSGGYSVNDYFGEARLPVAERLPGIHSLNINASYRHSDYSTGTTTNTYGLGLQYQPVKEVQLRGSYQQAVRAANVVELFRARGMGLYDADSDPCAGATPTASAAACAHTGVTASQYGHILDNSAGQYNNLSGGNPTLKPETANSITLGGVFQPSRDLTLSLDYFSIKVKDLITSVPATVTLQQCLDTGNPLYCGKVHRDALGTLWLPDAYIEADNQNIGYLKTSGVDVAADYSFKLAGGWGKLDLSLMGTYLAKYEVQDLPGLATYDCAGLFGATCGTPSPTWRHKLRTTWETPWGVSLAATWRHMNGVNVDTSSSQERLHADDVPAFGKRLGARDYIDLAASYQLTRAIKLRAGINNLFDRDPPLRANGSGLVNGNTYPVVYDAMGRRVTLNLTATF